MSILQSLLMATLVWMSANAGAQYPERAIQWIVPYPAGGGSDAIGRVVGEVMQAALGQPVVIENKPGAATNVAVAALLQAKPDGYTLMQAQEAALVLNAHLFKKLAYKPESDFSYIGAIARLPVALVVDASLPIHSVKELIDYVAANPSKANYALPGIGTPHHIAMELFKQSSGLRLTAVPYKGGAAALQDVMAGRLPTMTLDLGTGLQSIKAGKIRVLAIAARQRAQALPDVPTLDELGFKGVSVDALQALIGPAGMPDETGKLLNAALNKALLEPKVRGFFADIGAEALPGSPDDLKRMVRAGDDRWRGVIKSLDLQMD